ncbi:MAG TPA: LON peptidase substrate-binding domain-containing protein [Spirochaetota bacterium]|nr:LON peptidase substrate-binding domain-containing protein [Spirochaetota bacterium]
MKAGVFPMEVVVFPGQQLNLHISEKKYRQLIHEVYQNELPFILASLNGKQLAVHATAMKLLAINKIHSNGGLDITARGESVLKITKYFPRLKNRLYPGAEAVPVGNMSNNVDQRTQKQLFNNIKHLNNLLNRNEDFSSKDIKNISFAIGQKIGFSIKQKIKLLSLTNEKERQKLINDYLEEVIPILQTVVNKK